MTEEYVQVSFDKIVQTRVYTAIVLRNKDFRFAIFTDPYVGDFLQMHLGGEDRERPATYDFISSLFKAFDVQLKQILINDVQDTIFFAKAFLELSKGEIRHIAEIDARPSDCIVMAFLQNAPVFCNRHVLEKATPYIE